VLARPKMTPVASDENLICASHSSIVPPNDLNRPGVATNGCEPPAVKEGF